MNQDRAEIIALGALAWLAQAELLDTFMSATGAERDAIRQAAESPDFLGAILDFAMLDDNWVRGICDDQGLPYETLILARAALPGGNLPHWT